VRAEWRVFLRCSGRGVRLRPQVTRALEPDNPNGARRGIACGRASQALRGRSAQRAPDGTLC